MVVMNVSMFIRPEDDLESQKQYYNWIFQLKSHEKEVLHTFLSLFVKNYIFFIWPWNWRFDLKDDLE